MAKSDLLVWREEALDIDTCQCENKVSASLEDHTSVLAKESNGDLCGNNITNITDICCEEQFTTQNDLIQRWAILQRRKFCANVLHNLSNIGNGEDACNMVSVCNSLREYFFKTDF